MRGRDALLLSYKKTGVIPPALANEPEITPQLRFYFEAFAFVSRFRTYGMSGPNPISLPDIRVYADKIGYTSTGDFLFFAEIMSACDQVYLEDYQRRSKAESESKKKKQPPKKPARR